MRDDSHKSSMPTERSSFGRIFCLLIVVAVLSNACRTQKKPTTEEKKDSEFYETCYPAESISFNGCKLNITVGGNSLQLNGSIYARRDSAVFFRGTMLVEVVRGVVYRDSFAVINRLERICYKGSNEYLSRMAGYPVNPESLTMLLTADRCDEAYRRMGFKTVSRNDKMMLYTDNIGLEISVNPETQTTQNIISTGNRNQTSFRADYSRYVPVSRCNLPGLINVSAFDGKTAFRFSADFPEIIFNEHRSIRFDVPKGYKIKEMK